MFLKSKFQRKNRLSLCFKILDSTHTICLNLFNHFPLIIISHRTRHHTAQKLDLYFPYFTTECAIFQDVSLSISFKKLRFSILFKKTSRKTENIWMVFCEELCAFASTHSIIARYFLYIITKIFLAKISP